MFFTNGVEDVLVKPIYGFNGLVVVFSMYARYQFRNASLHSQLPQITYQNFPIIIVSIQIILRLIGFRSLSVDLPFTLIALLFSWSYLRFYYKFNESGELGDKSEDFAFVSMFPEVVSYIFIFKTFCILSCFLNIF
jgi:hypothetical protein